MLGESAEKQNSVLDQNKLQIFIKTRNSGNVSVFTAFTESLVVPGGRCVQNSLAWCCCWKTAASWLWIMDTDYVNILHSVDSSCRVILPIILVECNNGSSTDSPVQTDISTALKGMLKL